MLSIVNEPLRVGRPPAIEAAVAGGHAMPEADLTEPIRRCQGYALSAFSREANSRRMGGIFADTMATASPRS